MGFVVLSPSKFANAVPALAVFEMTNHIETKSYRRNSAGEGEEETIRVILDYAI